MDPIPKVLPQLQNIAVEKLCRGKYQSRVEFDHSALAELAESIRNTGLLQPIVVRPSQQSGHYEIIAGERRWRAAQRAQLQEVPCLVKNYSDEQAAEANAVENLLRVNLNPIEEARAYQRMIDDFGYCHEEIAAAICKSRVKITNTLRLLKLNEQVQELLILGKLTEGHGKVLASLSKSQQIAMAKQAIARSWSVRKLEREVKNILSSNDVYTSSEEDPDVIRLERILTEQLGCQSQIDFSSGRGKLHIDFHNIDVLQGILAKLGVVSS